jgi:hypothetical protein
MGIIFALRGPHHFFHRDWFKTDSVGVQLITLKLLMTSAIVSFFVERRM